MSLGTSKWPNECSHIVNNLRVIITVGKIAMENFDDALLCSLGQCERLADVELAKLCGGSWNAQARQQTM